MTREEYELLWQLAERVARSAYYGRLSRDQAFLLMAYGRELGLAPITALDVLHVINGRPALSPRGALALLRRSPEIQTVEFDRLTDAGGQFAGYRATIIRRTGASYSAEWTLADAERAGLLRNPQWRQYPEQMCLWRALGRAADMGATDVLAGGVAGLNWVGEPAAHVEVIAPDVPAAMTAPAPAPARLTLDDLDDALVDDDPTRWPEPEPAEEGHDD